MSTQYNSNGVEIGHILPKINLVNGTICSERYL